MAVFFILVVIGPLEISSISVPLFDHECAVLASNAYSNEMPPECEGQSYCTTQPEYHLEEVAAMDRVFGNSKYWEGDAPSVPYTGSRTFYSPSDKYNCAYVTKEERPFIIQVEQGNQLVVQTDRFVQLINTTTCLENSSCFEEVVSSQSNIVTSCAQKKAKITLYVFQGGEVKAQPFEVNVSCACEVKYREYFKK